MKTRGLPRKRYAEDDDDGSVSHDPKRQKKGLLKLHGTPKNVASKLLATLPENATLVNANTKSLLRAFDLVKAELQHRNNQAMVVSEEEGNRRPLEIRGVRFPEDVIRHILDFLPKTDLVHKISMVSKAFLSIAKSPRTWHTLDASNALSYRSRRVTNMTQFLTLLKKPQFTNLVKLGPPDKVRMRMKALEEIAERCPMLQSIDLGYSFWSNMHISPDGLCQLPSLFPHLKEVKFDTFNLTIPSICQFFEAIGGRLKSLSITQRRCYCTDGTVMNALSSCCPNLESFQYNNRCSIIGIVSFIQNARSLKNLALIRLNDATADVDFKALATCLLEQRRMLSRFLLVPRLKRPFLALRERVYDSLEDCVEDLQVVDLDTYWARSERDAHRSNQSWY